MLMLAQMAGSYSLVQVVVWAIILCAVIGIGMIAIRQSGTNIPGWAIQIFWIVIVAIVAIFAIKFLLGVV